MKSMLFSVLLGIFFLFMLIFSKTTFYGAREGLLLWFQIVLPTLFPFLLIINLLTFTNALTYLCRLIGPVFQRVFRVSEYGSFAVMTGFLCGYPVGAKTTADLVRTHKISKEEGSYLLSFVNNASPAFIISYIFLQQLKEKELLLPSLFILFVSPFLCSMIFRKFYRFEASSLRGANTPIHTSFRFETLDFCIMNTFETITKVGGYIILFSVIFSFCESLPVGFLLPFLEITNGIPFLLEHTNSFFLSYILVMGFTSFGGFCSIAQTKAMLTDTDLSIRAYIIEKLITMTVTSILSFLYVYFINR